MGSVYKAYQTKLRRKVALKVLALEHADKKGFVERFNWEVATGARITHRNVVRVYDILTGKSYDEDDVSTEVHVISMEYVDGLICERSMRRKIFAMINSERLFRQFVAVFRLLMSVVANVTSSLENIMLDRDGRSESGGFWTRLFVDRDVGDAVWDNAP